MAHVGTILTADFGSVHTRVVLVDVVDGEYRIVAREEGLTTRGFPVDDVGIGLQRLVNQIEDVTGRQLYNSRGNIITPEDASRRGVDKFITTTSAGRPIRAVMVGLMPDISLVTALRAISSAYVEPVAQIHLRDGLSDEERLNAILLGQPDLIFIAGGTDGGAQTALIKILQIVRLALRVTDPALRPTVVYAGNSAISAKIEEMFGELTALYQSDNIRPTMSEEAFESVLVGLGKAYDEHRESHGSSFVRVSAMTETGILPTPQSYVMAAEYFARVKKGNVLVVDVGSTSSILVGVFNGHTSTRISTTKGLGHSAYTLLQEVGEDAVAQWLPFYPQPNEIQNYALNKSVRPRSVPMDLRDLYKEHALLRAGVRQMMHRARDMWPDVETTGVLPPITTIIAGGAALTNTGTPAYDMLLIADCLQPTGITEIKTDVHGMIPAMNALARTTPEAVVHLLEGDGLEHLGTLVSIEGQPQFGRKIAQIDFVDADDVLEIDGGDFTVVTVPAEIDILRMRITCQRGFSIGGKQRINIDAPTGSVFVFDARGRVFSPPSSVADRATQIPQWVAHATRQPIIPIPEEWLIAPDAPVGDTSTDKKTANKKATDKKARGKKDDKKARGKKTSKDKETDGLAGLEELAGLGDEEDLFAELAADDDEMDLDDEIGSLRDLL